MTLTKRNHHDKCEVQLVFGRSYYHLAHLECIDKKCKRKKKFIQWLSHQTVDDLKQLGIPTVNLAENWL